MFARLLRGPSPLHVPSVSQSVCQSFRRILAPAAARYHEFRAINTCNTVIPRNSGQVSVFCRIYIEGTYKEQKVFVINNTWNDYERIKDIKNISFYSILKTDSEFMTNLWVNFCYIANMFYKKLKNLNKGSNRKIKMI